MSKLRQKKQQILRFLFGSFSATALMFTFQACYGMPNNGYRDFIEGQVVSEDVDQPIQNVRVHSSNNNGEGDFAKTDEEGYFTVGVDSTVDSVAVSFQDMDGEENGLYADLDTLMSVEEAIGHPHVFKMKEKSAE